MLEGSEKKNWFLWSFNSSRGVVFRIESTRAGTVAANFLKDCACRALVTDAYRGYAKAPALVNEMRKDKALSFVRPPILQAYCNAHARNNFQASAIKDTRIARRIRWIYAIIFVLYRDFLILEGEEFEAVKAQLERAFLLIKRIAKKEIPALSKHSALRVALEYFITYYDGLTLFLSDRSVPMHNNQSEGTLRNPVVGRKTWYGTHSIDTARHLAQIMSLVESCKLLKINPRQYVDDAVNRFHKGLAALSPYEYRDTLAANSS
jgi:hypothetical protein